MNIIEVNVISKQFDAVELTRKKFNFECKDEPMYFCNLTDIVNKYHIWIKHMPRVIPFYGNLPHDRHSTKEGIRIFSIWFQR